MSYQIKAPVLGLISLRFLAKSHKFFSSSTLVSTLSACAALRNLELGKEIHLYIKSELEFTVLLSNALLGMYSKCGCLIQARQIFDEMLVKNVISWTGIVSGYVNSGQIDEARELSKEVQ